MFCILYSVNKDIKYTESTTRRSIWYGVSYGYNSSGADNRNFSGSIPVLCEAIDQCKSSVKSVCIMMFALLTLWAKTVRVKRHKNRIPTQCQRQVILTIGVNIL